MQPSAFMSHFRTPECTASPSPQESTVVELDYLLRILDGPNDQLIDFARNIVSSDKELNQINFSNYEL